MHERPGMHQDQGSLRQAPRQSYQPDSLLVLHCISSFLFPSDKLSVCESVSQPTTFKFY